MENSSTSASIGTRLTAKSRSQCARIFAAIASTSGHLRTRIVPLIEYHADISDPLLCSSPRWFLDAYIELETPRVPACSCDECARNKDSDHEAISGWATCRGRRIEPRSPCA